MVAAAAADMPTIDLKLLRTQSAGPRFAFERCAEGHQLAPRGGRRHVDLNHARIGRDLEPSEARRTRRRVALKHDRLVDRSSGILHSRHQLQPVVGHRHGRQEAVQPALPPLCRHGCSHEAGAFGNFFGRGPGQLVHRQPVASRRVASHKQQRSLLFKGGATVELGQRPGARPPASQAGNVFTQQRQHPGHRLTEGQRGPLPRVVACRHHAGGVEAELMTELSQELARQIARARQRPGLRLVLGRFVRLRGWVGNQLSSLPDRRPVGPPEQLVSPPRKLFAGILLALPFKEHSAVAERVEQPSGEPCCLRTFLGAVCCGVPLRTLKVVDREVGRLAAAGQPHVVLRELGIHLLPQGINSCPGIVGEGPRGSRLFGDAVDPHDDIKGCLAGIDAASHRGGAEGVGSARQRNVALGSQQAAGGIQANPAGPWQVGLSPCMQVGEIAFRSGRAVDRLHVGCKLNQIARAEPGCQSQPPQHRHQQPG